MYLVAGLLLLAGGTLFGAVHWWASVRYGTPATTGTVMLAALPVIMGFQFLLQCVGLDIQGQPTECLSRDLVGRPDTAAPLDALRTEVHSWRISGTRVARPELRAKGVLSDCPRPSLKAQDVPHALRSKN